jgi:hypothetical protein
MVCGEKANQVVTRRPARCPPSSARLTPGSTPSIPAECRLPWRPSLPVWLDA